MWILSTLGFFSVVQKPEDRWSGTLTVRARVATDLDRLRDVLPELGRTQESHLSDYQFRGVAPRNAVAAAVARSVTSINYPNFKDAVAHRQGKERAGLYGDVWGVLYGLGLSQEGEL